MRQGKMKPHTYVHKCLLVFVSQWIAGASAAINHPLSCCMKTTDQIIRISKIVRYELQEAPLCPVRAVRFFTRSNDTVCSDPRSLWARKAMMMVGRRISTTGVPEVIKKRTTSLPGTTTLPWSTVTWVSPGLTTTNWMEEFVTNTSIPVTAKDTESIAVTTKAPNVPSTIDKSTTSTKYPSISTKEAPTATSISTRTLRTATRASTQDPSMTTSVTTQPSDITYVIATSLTTEEPPRRTKEQQPWKHTIGTTKRASTVDTSARSSMASLTPEMENETHTTAVSSRSTTPSPKTTVWEPLGNSGPPPRRTFAATTAKRTLTLTTTIPRSSIEAATVATARPDQASKVTRLTWLHRRLKKKSKMGLRRAQRKPRG